MNKRTNRVPPALKHGCYSGLALLPGEDRDLFNRLHRDLVAEFAPDGRSEEIIVENMAQFMWRRQNLAIYRLAEHVRRRHTSIYSKLDPPPAYEMPFLCEGKETRSPEELRALRKEADEQAERELGPALKLVEVAEVAETDYLLNELSLIERLDGMIARCVKQLLLVRGCKSISLSPSAELAPARIKRIA